MKQHFHTCFPNHFIQHKLSRLRIYNRIHLVNGHSKVKKALSHLSANPMDYLFSFFLPVYCMG